MKYLALIYFLLLLGLSACQDEYAPKPRGYFRIKFPEKNYEMSATGCPFDFEKPVYARFSKDTYKDAQPCWLNLDFPQFNARLHLSYFDIGPKTPFAELSEDARAFAFKHTVKATSIDQLNINYPERKVYGLQYTIKGNTASNTQFYVSDSIHHYLRGALYFNEKPNLDSIKPVLEFIQKDIDRLIQTIKWN